MFQNVVFPLDTNVVLKDEGWGFKLMYDDKHYILFSRDRYQYIIKIVLGDYVNEIMCSSKLKYQNLRDEFIVHCFDVDYCQITVHLKYSGAFLESPARYRYGNYIATSLQRMNIAEELH